MLSRKSYCIITSFNLNINDRFALSCCNSPPVLPSSHQSPQGLGGTLRLCSLSLPRGFGCLCSRSAPPELCHPGPGLGARAVCERGLWEASLGASTRTAQGWHGSTYPSLCSWHLCLVLYLAIPILTLPCWSGVLPQLVRPALSLGLLADPVYHHWTCSALLVGSLWLLLVRCSPAYLAATPAPIPHPALAAPGQN